MGKDKNNSIVPYPEEQEFNIWINANESYGKLVTQIGEEGTSVCGIQPFTFVASDTISADSVIVELEAWPTPSCGGVASSIISGVKGEKDTLPEGTGRIPSGLMMKMQANRSEIGITGSTQASAKERITTRSMEKLRKRLYAIREKSNNKSQFDRIIEKIEARLAGTNRVTKNTIITPKPLANIGQIAMSVAEGSAVCDPPVATVTIKKEKSCEDAPQCPDIPMLPPFITLQIQPNGFAGNNLCAFSNPGEIRLGIFGLLQGSNAVVPFSVDACFDKNTGKWRFFVPEIKLNAIEDLCTANISANGFQLIDNCNQVPSSDSLQAIKDLTIQKNYYGFKDPNDPSYKVKYISTQGLVWHENKHERDNAGIINSLRPEWEKLFNEIQPACEEYKDIVEAAEKGWIAVKIKLTPFMDEFDKRFALKYYDKKKANPNSPDYDPAEKGRKDKYEQDTQKDLIVQLFLDDLIKHIPCN
jgi:hypothetical protein